MQLNIFNWNVRKILSLNDLVASLDVLRRESDGDDEEDDDDRRLEVTAAFNYRSPAGRRFRSPANPQLAQFQAEVNQRGPRRARRRLK